MKTEDIKINNNIESKAIDIINKKKEEKRIKRKELKAHKKYIKKCVKAEICPVCSNNLKKLDSSENQKYAPLYTYDHINFILECKDHFVHVDGDHYDYDDFDD